MQTYVAFLRGINVGGHGLVKMSDLTAAISKSGYIDVRSYIQSGNILFSTDSKSKVKIASHLTNVLNDVFSLTIEIAVFSKDEWIDIIASSPSWWGEGADKKHNIFILTKHFETNEILSHVDALKTDSETIALGNAVIYQSILIAAVSRGTTGSKLVSKTIYKHMTIRNFATTQKIRLLLS